DQQHFAYLSEGGAIWDAFFFAGDNKWHLQQISQRGRKDACGVTDRNAAVDGPFVNTFAGHDQQHFSYRDKDGVIWDSFYFSGDNSWHLQQINLKRNNGCATTDGPKAVAGPFVDTFAGHDQQHFAYMSEGGAIWDAFFFAGDNKWHLQQIQRIAAPSVGPFSASPIVVNDTVFIGSDNGYFYALDAATGALKWQFPKPLAQGLIGSGNFAYGIGAGASFWGGVRPHGAVIFAAQDPSLGEGGRLFALDAATGKPIANWPSKPIATIDNNTTCDKTTLHQRIEHSSPLIFNDKAYVGIQSFENPVQVGQVAAVDLATGQKDNNFTFFSVADGGSLGGGVWNAPATDGTSVYFTTGNVRQDACGSNPQPNTNYGLSMVGVDKDTGKINWELQPVPFALDDDPDWAAGATVMNTKSCGELIASVQKDGWSYAVNPATKSCSWQFPPDPARADPSSACSWTGYSKFDPNGEHKHGAEGYRQPGAAWKDQFVVVTAGEDLVDDDLSVGYQQLHALNACEASENKRVGWIAFVPPRDFLTNDPHGSSFALSAPTVTDGIVFIGTDGGHLVVFGDPSVASPAGTSCSNTDFNASNCPAPYVLVQVPRMLADIAMPDGGNIAYFHKEAALAKGKVFVASGGGHVYMLEP
ncbi:MAG: PQQ-binding-like beta-propeller repeat protein, partial [Methylocella sp.]